MLLGSIMLYMLMITAFIAFRLHGKAKKIGIIIASLDLISISAFMVTFCEVAFTQKATINILSRKILNLFFIFIFRNKQVHSYPLFANKAISDFT